MKPGVKRTLIQFTAAITTNSYFAGFVNGTIFKGKSKQICVPGLNCYSCPGAIGSCPIGAMQSVEGGARHQISFYALGFLMLAGTLFGRLICGFICPFGLIQDMLHKIKFPKIKVPVKLDHLMRYIKYGMFIIPVLLLPMFLVDQFGMAPPYFCEYFCPVGTLEGGIILVLKNESLRQMVGVLFQWKMAVLIGIVVSSLMIYRPFCKYFCPLGAFYALFNRVSFYRMHVDSSKCSNCKACERSCQMQVKVVEQINAPECIRCGKCKEICPSKAISSGFFLKNNQICEKELLTKGKSML